MALPVVNFGGGQQAPDLSNLSDIMGNIKRGVEGAAAPKEAAERYLHHLLQNELLRVQTKQAQQKIDLYNYAFGGDLSGGQGGQTGDTIMLQQPGGASTGEAGIPTRNTAPYEGVAQKVPGLSREALKRGILHKDVGLPYADYKVLPSGEVLKINSDGSEEVIQYGKSLPQIKGEETAATKKAEREAKVDEEYENTLRGTRNLEPTYQTLLPIVNSKEFLLSVGSGMRVLAKLSNNEKINQTIGTLETTLGNQVNRAFKQFRTQNAKEYSAVERIQGSLSDNPYALKAKINIANAYRLFDQQVAKNYLDLREANVPQKMAEKLAHENADFSEIRRLADEDNQIYELANTARIPYLKMREKIELEAAQLGVDVGTFLEAMGE